MTSRPVKRTLYALIPTAAVLFVATTALAAGNYAAGTNVAKEDWDFTPTPGDANTRSLCYRDLDQSGTFTSAEPLYLSLKSLTCAVTLSVDDIRLTDSYTYKAGTQLKQEDTDYNLPVSGPLTPNLRYIDVEVDSKFKAKDTLYLDLQNAAEQKVHPGDLRLTAYKDQPALAYVREGAPELGVGLVELVAGGVTLDGVDMVYKAGSTYYINIDQGAVPGEDVEEYDIRINSKAPRPLDGAAKLKVTKIATSPEKPGAWEPYQLNITVKNEATESGAGPIEVKVGGLLVDNRVTPSILPGKDTSILITLLGPTDPGTVEIDVLGTKKSVEFVEGELARRIRLLEERAAWLEQNAAETSTGNAVEIQGEPNGETSKDTPGPGGMFVLAAFAAAAVYVSRRRPA